MKTLKKFERTMKKNPDTDLDEEVPLMMTLELENRLDEDTNLDIQFGDDKPGFIAHQRMFKRDIGSSNTEEETIVKDIIEKITDYDEANQKFIMIEGLNNSLYIKNIETGQESIYKMNPAVLANIKDIVKWIYDQEKYMPLTEA